MGVSGRTWRVGVGVLLLAAACDNDGGEQSLRGAEKVTICHATGDASDPYVEQRPNANGTVNGHDGHANDIIPPFEYEGGQYPGKNWDAAGQAIWNNGCTPLGPAPTQPPAPPTEPAPTQPPPTEPPPTEPRHAASADGRR